MSEIPTGSDGRGTSGYTGNSSLQPGHDQGFHDERLKNLGCGSYWHELLERIRDIRSSEKVIYRQVFDLYATSVDYAPVWKEVAQFPDYRAD